MYRLSTVLLLCGLVAVNAAPAVIGSEAFVVDVSGEESEREETTSASVSSTTASKTEDTDVAAKTDPYEVLEAALGIINTPVHKMVGSNPLRRLLRLVGPSREDMVATLQMAKAIQDAVSTTETPKEASARRDNLQVKNLETIPTDLPPVVDEIFGFKMDDDKLFGATQKPLFPLVTIQNLENDNSELAKILKSNNIAFKH